MKKYNGLLMVLFIGFAGSLVASEKSGKSIFDEPTQRALKNTAFLYTIGYTFLHSAATATGLVLGVAATDLDWYLAKKNKENFSVIKSLRQEIPQMISFMNKGVARTHIVAAPFVAGYTYNQYEEYKSYKNSNSSF